MAEIAQAAAVRVVAVECAYIRRGGHYIKRLLLVPLADDPVGGPTAVNARAEDAAAEQLRSLASMGWVSTSVRASVPLASLAAGTIPPELVGDDQLLPKYGEPHRWHQWDQ